MKFELASQISSLLTNHLKANFNVLRKLISISRDQNPKIWDVITGNCLKMLEAHTDRKRYHCSVTGIIPSRTQKTTSPLVAMNTSMNATNFGPPPYTKSSTLGRAEQLPPGASGTVKFIAPQSRNKTVNLRDVRATCIINDNWVQALLFHHSGKISFQSRLAKRYGAVI
ncbi:hypothetical protein GX48_00583 [Paracoccidioides brasiliensis]|nr:hypothetical protein GX48_00583 [Paracoccidioides brasiliensis]